MGRIEFEGWKVVVDDIQLLNQSKEISRLGLVFEQHPGVILASASGNVAAYYVILSEVKERMTSCAFTVTVELSTGDKKAITLTRDYVIEDGEDITSLFE